MSYSVGRGARIRPKRQGLFERIQDGLAGDVREIVEAGKEGEPMEF